ncbi:energy transducer TonB [Mucilaginibacter sp. BJC16-A38]|uniref:energy transducer TonB n=1 Tax=Mucilaginibacter phenanthrenivorans TaxID=1234842 RepID=UPI002157033A|nr:energy transducer TonB [Mucilaginibacter phenanthrenivorans]MCR8560548.1 energy transducer TonB [Mucilaginibacter phenanthrenivorans]
MKKVLFTILLALTFLGLKAQTSSPPDIEGLEDKSKTDSTKLNAFSKANPTFISVEKAAEFPGGPDNFYRYIEKNMRYPKDSWTKKIEGKVIVSFVVGTDGHLTDVKILHGVAPDLDAEAIRLINHSPSWVPAIQNGRPVKVLFKIPVTFKI